MTDTAAEQAREIADALANVPSGRTDDWLGEVTPIIAAALRAADAGAIERATAEHERTLRYIIAQAGIPDPVEACRQIIATCERALASPSGMRSAESAHNQQPTEGGPESRTTENLGRPSTSPSARAERYRHRKRGTTYTVIGTAEAQSTNDDIQEGDEVMVYRSDEDGKLWVRPTDEFHDGRFERLPSPPASEA